MERPGFSEVLSLLILPGDSNCAGMVEYDRLFDRKTGFIRFSAY